MRMMKKLYHPFWAGIAVVVSIVAIIAGFPVFQRQFGFPISFFFTGAVVLGVCVNYFIRAIIFSNKEEKDNITT